ncbi:MAG: hypothetical protein OXR67_08110, partial [Chloroflexota bacterium]|nr:hypothetical protein [Chloroflexota bacterium]
MLSPHQRLRPGGSLTSRTLGGQGSVLKDLHLSSRINMDSLAGELPLLPEASAAYAYDMGASISCRRPAGTSAQCGGVRKSRWRPLSLRYRVGRLVHIRVRLRSLRARGDRSVFLALACAACTGVTAPPGRRPG